MSSLELFPLVKIPPKPRLFEEFWTAYPKKKTKDAARRAWLRVTKPLKPAEQQKLLARILASIAEHKATRDWQVQEGKFIPYPATFLNGGMWEDEIKAEPRCEGYDAEPENSFMKIKSINCEHSMLAHTEWRKRKSWGRYCQVVGCPCSVEETFV